MTVALWAALRAGRDAGEPIARPIDRSPAGEPVAPIEDQLAHRTGAEVSLANASPEMQELMRHAMAMLAAGQTSGQLVMRSDAARAYVYAGAWVADCPAGCNNTQFVTELPVHLRGVAGNWGVRKTVWHCSYCGHLTHHIEWPPDAEQIQAVLDRRPIPHNRNWYPHGHATAVKAGVPTGQSVEDLLAENAEHGVH